MKEFFEKGRKAKFVAISIALVLVVVAVLVIAAAIGLVVYLAQTDQPEVLPVSGSGWNQIDQSNVEIHYGPGGQMTYTVPLADSLAPVFSESPAEKEKQEAVPRAPRW